VSHDARLSTGLPGHPKTKKLVRRCGEAGAWHLVCLILWARDNRADGDLVGMTTEDIELAADWRGEADAFVAALVAVGFLDGEEGAYQLHDWSEHQPWANGSEARSEKARWAAMVRRHGREEAAREMPEYAARLATSKGSAATSTVQSATSSDVALLDSANGTNSPAPSPNPSPNPSPTPTSSIPPTPATAGEGKPARRKREKVTFTAFVQACREAGEKPIRPADPIFAFADDARIPREFLELAWREFARKHRDSGRTQKDWRAHFRDAVRGNWGKVWYFPGEGEPAALTTVGVQLKRERDAEAERRATQAQPERAA
jgi:hypothetical protein